MQTQVPAPQNPKPQFFGASKKLRIAALVVLVLTFFLVGYHAYQYSQQAERAEQIVREFEGYLAKGKYFEAYGLLRDLPEQPLGKARQEAMTSINEILTAKFAEITESILAEQENDFRTFLQINGFQVFSNLPDVSDIVKAQVQTVLDRYLAGKVEYEQIDYYLDNVARLGFTGRFLNEAKEIVATSEQARKNIRTGQSLFTERDYLGALALFLKVPEEDQKTYELAQIGIKQTLAQMYTLIDQWTARGQYEQALAALRELRTLFPGKIEVSRKIAAVEEAYDQEERSLVPYEGPVEHIFFHPLIAYPELAFDGSSEQKNLSELYLTSSEFQKIIEELYAKDFVLISPRDLYETKQEDGQEIIVPKQLKLPEGKKPLIISVDDVSYHNDLKANGIVHRLIVDDNMKVASYSISPDGREITSFDNAIVPILEAFVEQHPDFSFRGAKGVIALSSEGGILGYRTDNPSAPDYVEQRSEVQKIIRVLKENGWTFASYSQEPMKVGKETYDKLVNDMERWQKEVASLIGPTEVFIYPLGSSLTPDDPKFKYLLQTGFKVFCAVGSKPYLQYANEYILMDRRQINGIALLQNDDTLKDLFVCAEVVDPARRPLE